MAFTRGVVEVTCSDRLVQMCEAAIGNALSSTVDSRVDGTISADVDDDLSRCMDVSYTSKFITEIFHL